ncbi:hypothetical protein IKG49_02915 [Candidatus Saccharibacteria bacterium]|nr:hypothetical protein [Candidatus Saccharibacteria bacterium]
MKELEIGYYFTHLDEFFAPELFDNCENVWTPLNRINDYLDQKVVQPGLKENHATIGEYVSITGNYYIGEGTVIGANVSIEGPVYIGKNVTIQSGALLRPGTIIGDNAVIGHACETKHCIIQNGAKVQSFTFCGDSLIGKSTRIGSGTILANRRFDQSNIILKINGEKIVTDTDFFGAIIGDNTRLGANCTSTPGTLIGPYTWILPTVQVRNFVPAEKRVLPPTDLTIVDNPRHDLKP